MKTGQRVVCITEGTLVVSEHGLGVEQNGLIALMNGLYIDAQWHGGSWQAVKNACSLSFAEEHCTPEKKQYRQNHENRLEPHIQFVQII